MENNDKNQLFFSDIYIEQILREIKQAFKQNITIISNSGYNNICRDPFFKADSEIRKVLKGLLYPNNSEYYDGQAFDNNFLALQEGDTAIAKKKLRCSLILYYTALYFDNVELLMKLIQESVCFGEEPGNLFLCCLDKSVSDFFNHEKYAETIKRAFGFFVQCYKSVSKETSSKRKEYLAKFARIIEKREDLVYQYDEGKFWTYNPDFFSESALKKAKIYYNDNNIFAKETLDIFDESTYLKASVNQLKIVFGNVGEFKDSKNISRLNKLVTDKKYCKASVSLGERLFTIFSDDELLEMSYKTAQNFYFAYQDCMYLERVKNLYKQKPILGEYEIIFTNSFLSMLTDEEIISLPLESLNKISLYYFPNDLSNFDYERARNYLEKRGVYSNNDIAQISKPKQIGVKKRVKAFLGMKQGE